MINNCTKIIEKFLKEIQNNIFENDKNSKSKYKIENFKDLYLNKKLEINFLDDSICNVKIYNTNDSNSNDFTIKDSTKFKTEDLVKLLGALIGGIQYHLITTECNLKDFKEKVMALNFFLNNIELKNSKENTNFNILYSGIPTQISTTFYNLNEIIIPEKFRSDSYEAWDEAFKKEKNFQINKINLDKIALESFSEKPQI